MSRRVDKSAASRADLLGYFLHISQDSPMAGDRFLANAEATFGQLLISPNMGRAWGTRRGRLKGLRVWSISGFRNYLVFYRPVTDGIQIFRVLHGARDLGRALRE